jgi:glycosyltransferase involved in cell wall biosynthesis
MVGTIEPRKGYRQALAAFELLWTQQTDISLVIVGKQGWMVEDLIAELRSHPEMGKRLFWLDIVDDALLGALYSRAALLLLASEGEGFGLPVIEAARHGTPILVRDLAVFREVAGNHAIYFSGTDANALCRALLGTLTEAAARRLSSTGMRISTWEESCAALIDVVLHDGRDFLIRPRADEHVRAAAERRSHRVEHQGPVHARERRDVDAARLP